MRHFRYNPRWQEPEELERIYVARKALLERLHAQITEQGTSSVPRHFLVIGQRGMGKTTLLARLQLELNRKNSDFLPLTFWEEQYVEVDRLSVFWLNCLDSMADAFEASGKSDLVKEIDQHIRSLESIPNEEDRSREAMRCFEETIKRVGRRLVLFIDNFNLLMSKLKAHDYVLRGFFTRHGAPIIIGAGVTPPDDVADYDAAFYDGFQTTLLHRLSLEEVQEMIQRLAEERDESDAISTMWRQIPRIAALRDLSGGNPRTCLLIYRLCVQGFSESIYRDLETLLDETTPLFQSRFEQLSDQGQKLIARLAKHWMTATAETITEITGFPRGTVSPLLGRLEADGIIEKVSLFDPNRRDLQKGKIGGLSKKLGYQISERFFSIWLIMRSSSRRDRDGVRCLSYWLESLYTPEELASQAKNYACLGVLDWDQAILGRALAECMKSRQGGDVHDLRRSSEISLLSFARKGIGNLEGVMDEKNFDTRALNFEKVRHRLITRFGSEFADLVLGSPSRLVEKGLSKGIITQLEDPNLSETRLTQLLKEEQRDFASRVGDEAQIWLSYRLSQGFLPMDVDSQSLEAALDKAPNAQAKALVGALAYHLQQNAVAEVAYREALSNDNSIYYAWEGLALIYHHTNRYQEARDAYSKALDINNNSANTCSNYGQLLAIDLGQIAAAEPWLRRAVELDPRNVDFAQNLAVCLWSQDGKEKAEEAIREFKRAAALNMFEPEFHVCIGQIYEQKLKDYAQAETSYRKAISMNRQSPKARVHLANLLQICTHDYPDSEYQYKKAIEEGDNSSITRLGLGYLLAQHLNRPAEGVHFLEAAISIDPKFELALDLLAVIQRADLHQYDESKKTLLKLLAINPENANALNSLGHLEYDFFGNYTTAAKYFECAISADPTTDMARHNLIALLRDTLGEMARAKDLFADLREPDSWKDSQALHRTLFACYEDNWGTASTALAEALSIIGYGAFPKNTEDDWFRASAVMLKLGFAEKLLKFLNEQGCKQKMMPWFAALEAHQVGDKQLLLNYPAEARPAAELIFDQIQKRQKTLMQHA